VRATRKKRTGVVLKHQRRRLALQDGCDWAGGVVTVKCPPPGQNLEEHAAEAEEVAAGIDILALELLR
jgi:hypothetical protein